VTLGIPLKIGGTGSCRDPKESESDIESLSFSSVAGDPEIDIDDESDILSQISAIPELFINAQDKRIGVRLKSIDELISILNRSYVPESLDTYASTAFEIIEKNLKRTLEESMRMCSLVALFSIQLGLEIEDKMCTACEILRGICIDPAASEILRSVSAQSLGLCVYLSVDQFNVRYDALQTLKNIWTGLKQSSSTSTSLFSSALYSWALILDKFDTSVVMASMDLQSKLCSFLDSTSVESRISTGQTLAILYELAVENVGENFCFKNHEQLETALADLAFDSAKFRAKRDKKLQRLTFRQINDTIFGGKSLNIEVKFNKREKLTITSCRQKLLYDSLCQLLRGHLNYHLTTNEFIREIFDLGPVIDVNDDEDPKSLRMQKTERMSHHLEQSKSRNIRRSKHRSRKHDHGSDYDD